MGTDRKNWKIIKASSERNLKLFQVAEFIGMTAPTFNRSINGKRPFTIDEKRSLSKLFRIPQKKLFAADNENE
uniref:Putative excise n=1 Tax=viral metagenome TaxID=1070528 RepID=A0A6H1ZV61_9ZZZZ